MMGRRGQAVAAPFGRRVLNLQEALAHQQQENSALRERLDSALIELRDTRAEMASYRADLRALLQQLHEKHVDCGEAERLGNRQSLSIKLLHTRNQSLLDELHDTQRFSRRHQNDAQRLSERNQRIEAQTERVRNEYESRISALQREVAELRTERKTLEIRLHQLDGDHRALLADYSALCNGRR